MTRAAAGLLALLLPAAATAQQPLPVLDRIVVHKAARTMDLVAGGQVVAVFDHIALGFDPQGPKRFQGDGRTPEGTYVIDAGNPASAYRLSLHISYPSPEDVARAQAAGRDPGGAIFIHGQPNGRYGKPLSGDWTDGCIALPDERMVALWQATADGTPIDILP
jgi:murein L,D-transpeptidase YafK